MKRNLLLVAIFFGLSSFAICQSVGIGTSTPNGSAQLDITSATRGILIPRMNTATIAAMGNPAKGLLVYDSVKNQLMVNMGTSIAPDWQTIVAKSGWSLTGNNGTSQATNFIGTSDASPFIIKVNNVRAGFLDSSTTALGFESLYRNTFGTGNTGLGNFALGNMILGYYNTAVGFEALYSDSTFDSAHPYAIGNTAVGFQSLYNNAGNYGGNTAIGHQSLFNNKTGSDNTAIGIRSLFNNVDGTSNTALGEQSLLSNISGFYNTALGNGAMLSNTSGYYNTAVGNNALNDIRDSYYNTAIGYNAAVGRTLGYNNTILGANCNVNADGLFNCIAIGQAVICTGSSQARIGNSATTSIGGYAGWSNFSDGRYKKNIQENVSGTDFIMKLRPVTYQLDVQGISNKLNENRGQEINEPMKQSIAEKEKIIFSGFIAQEVEKAARESGYDFSGVDAPKNENDFYGLRYGDFVVPLVKTAQEQQLIIQEQRAVNDKQQQTINDLQTRLQSLEEQIRLLIQSSNHKN